jgi:hypothetical protein
MRRSSLACAALALASSLLIATPASAEGLTAACEAQNQRIDAWAYYTPAGPWTYWDQFQYELTGGLIGDQSNVNIWVMENYTARWSWHSPDSLDDGIRYTTNTTAYTSAAAQEWIRFEAIFDYQFYPDPRCEARTQSL